MATIPTYVMTLHSLPGSPLLMHNGMGADRKYGPTIEKAKITSKRKKTEAELDKLDYLDWVSGLYLDEVTKKLILPTTCIKATMQETAKATKDGKLIERGLVFMDPSVPFNYDGPDDIEKLYQTSGFVNRDTVVVSRQRIVRQRPQFKEWYVTARLLIDTTVIDVAKTRDILERAGRMVGMCDNRTHGYGRFVGTLEAE